MIGTTFDEGAKPAAFIVNYDGLAKYKEGWAKNRRLQRTVPARDLLGLSEEETLLGEIAPIDRSGEDVATGIDV